MGIKIAFKKMMVEFTTWLIRPDGDIEEKDRYSLSNIPSRANIKSTSANNNIAIGNNGVNFTIYNAIGGKIVQIQTYDPRTDRTRSELYIVTDKENLGEELSQIITRDSLAR